MSLVILEGTQAYCTRMRQFTYRLQWWPARHYVAGAQVELRSHCQRAFISWRYTDSRIEAGDTTFRTKVQPTGADYLGNTEHIVFRATLPYGAQKGLPLEFSLTTIPPVWAGISNILSVWTIDVPSSFRPGQPVPPPSPEPGSECELTVVAGPVERLSVYSRPQPAPDGTVRTLLVPEDRFGNPGSFASPLLCDLVWNAETRAVEVQDTVTIELPTPVGTQRAQLTVPVACPEGSSGGLAANENIANGCRVGSSLLVTGNPVWPSCPTEALGPDEGLASRAAFGEFHWHTGISADGQRTMAEALRCARDYLNMDFAAPSDHNPMGPAWQETVTALEDANCPDDFATFFGWENATDRGHENYYFTEPSHPLVCGGEAGVCWGWPSALAAQLQQVHGEHDFISVPHHTNAVADLRRREDDSPFWHPYPWDEPQEYTRLVEMMQLRGNQEQEVCDDAWRGWHQNNGGSVERALALGHVLGFTGGTDNHCGWPGRAFAEAEGFQHPVKSVILTGVWTARVERQAIFSSLRARHTWAVWDTRALVWFTLNGAWAGDELHAALGTALIGHLVLSAEDALQTVEVISEGRVVWQRSFAELDIDIQIPLGRMNLTPAACRTHYYVRALQRNGGIIYTSPVYVTVR